MTCFNNDEITTINIIANVAAVYPTKATSGYDKLRVKPTPLYSPYVQSYSNTPVVLESTSINVTIITT
ncbi:hypothetical protein FACS189459_7380 [Bacilli bacterium]|nr:hypothetical protein FACS189459_7380 [Bacilli bacterium]